MGKHSGKPNIPMCAALILLCLTLISTHLTCGLYARYTSSAAGSDSARVAKFDVNCTLAPNEGTDDEPNDFIVTVKNNSEVAVSYSIIVETEATMDVTLKKGDTLSVTKTTDEDNRVIFSDTEWKLAPNAAAVNYDLVLALKSWNGLTEDMENISDTKDFGFTVRAHVVQVD